MRRGAATRSLRSARGAAHSVDGANGLLGEWWRLEFVAGAPDLERLKKLSQEELAKYCCEWFICRVLKLHPSRRDQRTRLQ